MALQRAFDAIKKETALQLFASVDQRRPIGPLFLTCLDDAISAAGRLYDEKQQRFNNIQHQYDGQVHPGDVIEFYGPACGGKTSILYFLILTTIVPPVWQLANQHIHIGGRAGSIIIFDLDQRFDIQRAQHLVRRHLENRIADTRQELLSEPSAGDIDILVTECLDRLHVFQPKNSLDFLAALIRLLPDCLAQCDNDDAPCVFLMIDSISAFYLLDKAEDNATVIRHIVNALKAIMDEWGVVVVSTHWAFTLSDRTLSENISTASSYPPQLTYRDSMPLVWQSFIKYRFVVARQPLPQYGPHINPDMVLKDPERQRLVNMGLCFGRMITPPDCGDIFEFQVVDDGVYVV